METEIMTGAGGTKGRSQEQLPGFAGVVDKVRRFPWGFILPAMGWAAVLASALCVHVSVEREVGRLAPVRVGQMVNRLEAAVEGYVFSDAEQLRTNPQEQTGARPAECRNKRNSNAQPSGRRAKARAVKEEQSVGGTDTGTMAADVDDPVEVASAAREIEVAPPASPVSPGEAMASSRVSFERMPEESADCLFCKIVSGAIPAKRLHETADTIAFADIHPQAPVHALVIPKRHIASHAHAGAEDGALLGRLMAAAGEVARAQGLENGYRLVVNTGADGGQTVDHLHVHVLGGRAMGWPPG